MAKTVQQLSLRKPAAPLARNRCGRQTLHASLCAIRAWGLAITFDFSLCAQDAGKNSLRLGCGGGWWERSHSTRLRRRHERRRGVVGSKLTCQDGGVEMDVVNGSSKVRQGPVVLSIRHPFRPLGLIGLSPARLSSRSQLP